MRLARLQKQVKAKETETRKRSREDLRAATISQREVKIRRTSFLGDEAFKMIVLTMFHRLKIAGLVRAKSPATLKDLADWRWQQTLQHTRTHGGLKSGDSTFAVYRHMSQQVRQNLVHCNASALAMVGYEGDISELDKSRQNISFLCLVASILTAEYARNCKAGEKFMASQSESNDLTPHRSLDAYGEGNVSTTKNLDTLSLRKCHLYGF